MSKTYPAADPPWRNSWSPWNRILLLDAAFLVNHGALHYAVIENRTMPSLQRKWNP